MPDGFLEVCINDYGEIVINHPDLQPDEYGHGHIVFSVPQAEQLVAILLGKIAELKGQGICSECGGTGIQNTVNIASLTPDTRPCPVCALNGLVK